MVNVKNSNTNDLTDTEETIVNTDNEEERYLQICDVAGIPLSVKDTVQLHIDCPSLSQRLLGIVVDIQQSDSSLIVSVEWSDETKDRYESQIQGTSFFTVQTLRKMVDEYGQWVAATL